MRKTIADLKKGVYEHAAHCELVDRGHRRYHPFSFDLDSSALDLGIPEEHWDIESKRIHNEVREQRIEQLRMQYGSLHIDQTVQNAIDLGPKSVSILSYHNSLHNEVRRSFLIGAYYPALVSACALGERILNHMLLDLRDKFVSSPYYKKIYQKKSFDNWTFAVTVLTDWKVLANKVGEKFLRLNTLRNRSIHFNMETYNNLRDESLCALNYIDQIIGRQFGYFGFQPWFIEGTAGAQFVKCEYLNNPFVCTYIVPRSGFVGPLYGMERKPDGFWHHLDYANYGEQAVSDEEYARQYRERDPMKVVSRAMIEGSHLANK